MPPAAILVVGETGPATILVVGEREPRALTAAALSAAGYTVGVAGSEDEAVTQAEGLRPAAIVLHSRLEGGAAVKVARALRRAGHLVPLIAVGAESDVGIFAALVGASAIVAGRPTATNLVVAIERALESDGLTREGLRM